MSRRIAVIGVAVVLALAGAAAFGFGGRGGEPEPVASTTPATAEVSRLTLIDYEDSSGVIGFGAATPLRYTPPPPEEGQPKPLGLVTWLPPVGTLVERGQPLFSVDDRPVTLLIGPLPLYRGLKPGVTGNDVAQFEANLRDLGYTGFTVDQEYTESTATAVRAWQKKIGLAVTGEVAPGQLLYAAGPRRVAEHKVLVGDVATGDILATTGSDRSVATAINRNRIRGSLAAGTAVTVRLPNGVETAGSIRRTGQAETGDPDSIQVEVEVPDQTSLEGRDGSVTVRFVVAERKDVLAAPVLALVALAEGGYGLQVVQDGSTRYVAVQTGLFARGYVEITSGDVAVGTKVVVPRD